MGIILTKLKNMTPGRTEQTKEIQRKDETVWLIKEFLLFSLKMKEAKGETLFVCLKKKTTSKENFKQLF